MEKKGRPIGSQVRQNIVEILYFYHQMHGYDLSKIYNEIYTPVTLRLIYYHLKKGTSLGEFSVEKVEQKSGNYSWGETTQHIVYSLGPNATASMDKRVKTYLDRKKKEK
jgi:hypothetical protein